MGSSKIRILPVSLLSTYISVLLVSFICSLGNLDLERVTQYTHSAVGQSAEQHNHGSDHNHSGHSHDHSESEEDCCDDLTNRVIFDSKILVKELQISFSHFLLHTVKHCSIQILNSYEQLTALLYEIDRPPPRQASILIMIQVFRI